MQPIDKSLALLGTSKSATLTEIRNSYKWEFTIQILISTMILNISQEEGSCLLFQCHGQCEARGDICSLCWDYWRFPAEGSTAGEWGSCQCWDAAEVWRIIARTGENKIMLLSTVAEQQMSFVVVLHQHKLLFTLHCSIMWKFSQINRNRKMIVENF